MTAIPRQRRWDLDALRGAAVVGMVAYHALYDLASAGLTTIDPLSDHWRLVARIVLVTFLLVSGASDALVAVRTPSRPARWRKAGRRALILSAAAAAVTIATHLAEPDFYVRFGVLHCLAVAALLLPLLDRLPSFAHLALATGVLVTSWPLSQWHGPAWLLPLGITPVDFWTMDYVPLLPWFGIVMLGQSIGRRLVRAPVTDPPPSLWPLRWLGQRALLVYLLHQPVLLLLIWLGTTSGK